MVAQQNYTMGAMLRASASEHADEDAVIFPDCRRTYRDLANAARGWAKAFIAAGVQPGQHVGILLPTRIEFIEVFFGAVMAGGVAVPVNARYQAHELRYLVGNADLVLLVTTGRVAESVDFAERLRAAFPDLEKAGDPNRLALDDAPMLRGIVCLDEPCASYLLPREEMLKAGCSVSDAEVDARIDGVDAEDIAMILYTSGTTSNPKGAMISHRAQVANSRNLGRRYQVTSDDKVWSPLPIFHIAGILPMTMILDVGGAYMTLSHFDAGIALDMLGKEHGTIAYPSFVTIMQDLITHEKFGRTDLSALRVMNSNFAVQPEWIRLAVAKAMPHTIQVGTYGLTEAAGTVSTSELDDSYEVRTGRCGKPLAEWEIRVVNPETGKDCGPTERGEIVLRGPNMLKGYYNDPEKTAEALRGGWFRTGDIGSVDEDGNVMFHGRIKDMLKVGGENVAAAEIESMLQMHPAVKLAQVVGIPDERYSEVPVAFIELASGQTTTADELIEHCRGQLARFKLPRLIRFVDQWPMSTSKIQKFKLQQDLISELSAGQAV